MHKNLKIIHLVFTILLLILGPLAFLAGTDIYHGIEPDLTSEWTVLSSYFYLSFLYIIFQVVMVIARKDHRTKK